MCGFGLLGHAAFRFAWPNDILAMAAWLVALAGFLFLARRADSGRISTSRRVFADRSELIVFALILGLTAFLRFWRLADVPAVLHGDSVECGIQGLDILLGRVDDLFGFSPWYYTPYPAHLPYTASFALVGRTVLGLRLPSAVAGTLAVIPLYFLVRGWLGRRAAQLAATLFALSHAAIHFSRIGLWNIQVLLLELVSFAFLAAALRTGSAFSAAGAGIAAGLALYSYTAGRLILVVATALLAVQFLLGRRRQLVRVYGFFFVGVVVTAAPLVGGYLKHADVLAADRTSSVMALAEVNRAHVRGVTGEDTVAGILWVQTKNSIGGFVTKGDASGQYGTSQALVSPVTAALALAGLLIAALRFRETDSQLMLLWALLGFVLGSVLIIDPPSHTRLIMLFPVPFIFAAAAVEEISRRISRGGAWVKRLVVWSVCGLVIAQAAVFNLNGYRRYVAWIDVEDDSWDVLEVIQRFGAEYDFYLFGGPMLEAEAPAFRLFADDKRIVNGITPADIPQVLTRDSVFILIPRVLDDEPHMRNVATVISERYPTARREIVNMDMEKDWRFILYVTSTGGITPPSGGSGAQESN